MMRLIFCCFGIILYLRNWVLFLRIRAYCFWCCWYIMCSEIGILWCYVDDRIVLMHSGMKVNKRFKTAFNIFILAFAGIFVVIMLCALAGLPSDFYSNAYMVWLLVSSFVAMPASLIYGCSLRSKIRKISGKQEKNSKVSFCLFIFTVACRLFSDYIDRLVSFFPVFNNSSFFSYNWRL